MPEADLFTTWNMTERFLLFFRIYFGLMILYLTQAFFLVLALACENICLYRTQRFICVITTMIEIGILILGTLWRRSNAGKVCCGDYFIQENQGLTQIQIWEEMPKPNMYWSGIFLMQWIRIAWVFLFLRFINFICVKCKIIKKICVIE